MNNNVEPAVGQKVRTGGDFDPDYKYVDERARITHVSKKKSSIEVTFEFETSGLKPQTRSFDDTEELWATVQLLHQQTDHTYDKNSIYVVVIPDENQCETYDTEEAAQDFVDSVSGQDVSGPHEISRPYMEVAGAKMSKLLERAAAMLLADHHNKTGADRRELGNEIRTFMTEVREENEDFDHLVEALTK